MFSIPEEILTSISQVDYRTSSRLFLKAMQSGIIDEVIHDLENYTKSRTSRVLSIRDHVSYFLDLNVLYFAIELPSIDLLRLFGSSTSIEMLRNEVRYWVLDEIQKKHTIIIQDAIDFETLIESNHSLLVPIILEIRSQELSECIIPYSTTKRSDGEVGRYVLRNLWYTSFGRRILEANNLTISKNMIVGEKTWQSILGQLEGAGIDILQTLVRVDEDNWFEYIQDTRAKSQQKYDSEEIYQIQRMRYTWEKLRSDDLQQRIQILQLIRKNPTGACNEELLKIASREDREIRRTKEEVKLAIEILSDTGDQLVLVSLSKWLKNVNNPFRDLYARGISKMTSRGLKDFPDIEPRREEVYLKDRILLGREKLQHIFNEILAKTPRQLIKSDDEEEVILETLLKRASIYQKMIILSLTRFMDDDLATIVIDVCLNDSDISIQRKAKEISRDRWS